MVRGWSAPLLFAYAINRFSQVRIITAVSSGFLYSIWSFPGTTDAGQVKFKIINSPEDIKDFLKEAMDEIKNVKVADPVKDTGKVKGQAGEEEEEDEELKSLLWAI